jgi:SAM-dependent methyltransferase
MQRLWVCSGGFHDPGGVALDIKREAGPDVQGDAGRLPFRDASFDFVMADPPYSDAEAKELYGLERNVSSIALLDEMHRVCRPGGLLLLLHRIVPMKDPRVPRLELLAIVGVVPHGNLPTIRALTVWRRPSSLEAFEGGGDIHQVVGGAHQRVGDVHQDDGDVDQDNQDVHRDVGGQDDGGVEHELGIVEEGHDEGAAPPAEEDGP